MAFADYGTALVTGASGGIGAAVAERLRQEGLTVHVLARREAPLRELAHRTGCIPHVVDVADTEALAQLLRPLEIDVLVNNAGVGHSGTILTCDQAVVDQEVDINLRAVLHMVRLAVPGMAARDRGHVVNISSIAGIYNFEGNTAYHATKAAVHALSRQLRVDLFGRRVRVTEICPGRIATDIFEKANAIDSETAQQRFFEGYEVPTPKDVADAIAYAIGTPSYVNIGHIEIMPTFQVPGGLNIAKSRAPGLEREDLPPRRSAAKAAAASAAGTSPMR